MPFTVKKIKGIDTSNLDKLGSSVVDLAKYTEDEFSQVASALQGTDPDHIWNAPLPKPRRGTSIYADGTHWNPGQGEGPYWFNGTSYIPMGQNAVRNGDDVTFNSIRYTLSVDISGIDLNTETIGGFYNGTNLTHSPLGDAQWYYVEVQRHTNTNGYCTQRAWPLTSTTAQPFMWIRYQEGGTWGAWQTFAGWGASPIRASLGADVLLNNTANYFDGPSVAQGTVGTWFVSGTVTLICTSSATQFNCKLWDGTTIIASGKQTAAAANQNVTVTLSGFLATPAGNLRISCQDPSFTTSKIIFNASGNSKDSTITAYRIA